jgi:hypothetical protein
MLEIKNIVSIMKNAFDGLLSRPNIKIEGRISEFEYVNRNFQNWEAKKEMTKKKKNKEYPRTMRQLKKT